MNTVVLKKAKKEEWIEKGDLIEIDGIIYLASGLKIG